MFSKHGQEDLVEAMFDLSESREVKKTEEHCCEVDLVQNTIEKSVAKHTLGKHSSHSTVLD